MDSQDRVPTGPRGSSPGRAIHLTPDNPSGALPQEAVNRSVYHSPHVYRNYLSNLLTPPEIVCLLKYQPNIVHRDILDIGVGAGRTSRYLAPLARHYEAVDYSPVMVAYMRQFMPHLNVRQADFRDLGMYADRSFDFIFAPDNVIDALPHSGRLQALSEAARVLRSGGILAFSCHNIGYKKAFSDPELKWSLNPLRFAGNFAKYILGWWNHFRVAPLRNTTADYALLNDPGHLFACLHYYAAHSTVKSQVENAGMRLLEVFDNAGRVVEEGADVGDSPSLLYVAGRVS